jgi:hypothetical protein
LTDIGINSRVSERDSPIVNVAIEQLQLLAASGQDKIV